MINLFVGFDTREIVAHHVCINSIIRQSTQPLSITPLALNNLGQYSESHLDGSNQFVYSRFLVPHFMDYKGWALYIDGDMILRDDIVKLWNLRDDTKAVMCVHHDYKTKKTIKYLGSENQDYIKNATGAILHRFSWLDDELIGKIPIEWNWLPDEFGFNSNAKLLHFTLGAPCFKDYFDSPMAEEWHRERLIMNSCKE